METMRPWKPMMLLLLLAACTKSPGVPRDFIEGVAAEPTPKARLCQDPALDDRDFCMPTRLEQAMRTAPIRFLSGDRFGTGVSGVMKLRAELRPVGEDPVVFDVKWKSAPPNLSRLNNSPRKEVAAYKIQELFMDPERYVVPPTVTRCVTPQPGRQVRNRAGRDALPCVWGTMSYWVDGIDAPGQVDLFRFEEDPAYRLAIADLNLLLYLISHRDTHSENWFLSEDPDRVRALAVDNGMTFSGMKNPRLDIDWSQIRVPIPRDSVERLRALSSEEIRSLRVLGSWHLEGDTLVPARGPLPDDDGVLLEDGWLVHGLSPDELDALEKRVEALLKGVDDGTIETFDPEADAGAVAVGDFYRDR